MNCIVVFLLFLGEAQAQVAGSCTAGPASCFGPTSLLAIRQVRTKLPATPTEERDWFQQRADHHASSRKNLFQAAEVASQTLDAVDRLQKSIDTVPSSTASFAQIFEQDSNATYHATASASHNETLGDLQANDTKSLCRICGGAGHALMQSLQSALDLHAEAEKLSTALVGAVEQHETSVADFVESHKGVESLLQQIQEFDVNYKSSSAEFGELIALASNLPTQAEVAVKDEAEKLVDKEAEDKARAAYNQAHVATQIADEDVIAKRIVEAEACAGLGLAPLPVPTPAPFSEAPPLWSPSGDAVHTCCLPDSVVRVLIPADTIRAPASSIRLLLSKQRDYAYTLKSVVIGEQDGDGPNMKAGTVAAFNDGRSITVPSDQWTDRLTYSLAAGKNYLISFLVVVGPDGWVEWRDQAGMKTFVKDWKTPSDVAEPEMPSDYSEKADVVYNIMAIEVD